MGKTTLILNIYGVNLIIKIEKYEEIYGAFDFADLYDDIFWQIPDKGLFCEIGCFAGKSTAYFASKIKNCNRDITFVVVDNFSELPANDYGVLSYQLETKTIKEVFIQNMKDLKLQDYIYLEEGDSVEVAGRYPNKLYDGVFIDGDHSYEGVLADIDAWLPKIKDTGFIAGHDIDFPQVWRAVRERFPKFLVKNRSWFINLKDLNGV